MSIIPKLERSSSAFDSDTNAVFVKDEILASWWFEFDDLNWPNPALSKKWKGRARAFAEYGITTVVVFGFHFRWDYLPVLDRILGILKEVTSICHDFGIKIVDHHSATLVHRVRSRSDRESIFRRNRHHVPFYPDFPNLISWRGQTLNDWRQIELKSNQPVFFERYTAEIFCPNNPGFQTSYLEMVSMFMENCPFDGLMSDDLHFLPDIYSCVCPHCRSRFLDETRLQVPNDPADAFWADVENDGFQAWINARYRWTSEHYGRLREHLPTSTPIWGCASSVLDPILASIGFSPHLFASHCDVIFHEVSHSLKIGKDDRAIVTELAAFYGLAHLQNKPLVSLIYIEERGELFEWMKCLKRFSVIPWISKMVRTEDAIDELSLLSGGVPHFPDDDVEISFIDYSVRERDSVDVDEANAILASLQERCWSIFTNGGRPCFRFNQ